ncbi:MAG: FtsX-like permease family protein, partial [Longimicrobiales bacterium]
LGSGASLQQAEAELAAVATRLGEVHPETNRDAGIRIAPLREQVVRDVKGALFFLLAAVGVVLIVACANVANLLLIKASANRKQVALQRALGASRLRLSAQVLGESLLLGLSGAVVGVLLAFGMVKAAVALGPSDIPLLMDARIDGRVLAFTLIATLVTVVLVGVGPALRSGRPEVMTLLRQGGSRSRGSDDRRVLSGLTVSQIALAMVLLTAGGLVLRSFQNLLRVDPGLDAERVLTFQLELPMAATARYPAQTTRDVFFTELIERLERLPGVAAATMASAPPLEEEPSVFSFTRPGVEENQAQRANFRLVAPEYFRLLGIPIIAGRAIETADARQAPRVVVVSNALARSVWGTESPLGQRIELSFGASAEVVGVAGDVRTTGLDGEAARTVYVPAAQQGYNFMTVIVKSRNDTRTITPSIRQVVRELDSEVPVHHVRTLADLVTRSIAQQRFQTLLVSSFSLLVFILAVIGTYGVASYGVSQRTNELGIRLAFGATGRDLQRLVLRDGSRLIMAGIVLGGAAAVTLSRTLARFVFQISTLDVVTFTVAPTLLAVAALAATFLPAYRAGRVDPMRVIRSDS